MRRRSHLLIRLTVLVVLLGSATWVAVLAEREESRWDKLRAAKKALSQPIAEADARALLQHTFRLAQTGRFSEICRTITDDRPMCRSLLRDAEARGLRPSNKPPEVVGSTPVKYGLVLHLRVFPLKGEIYDADFAVTRTAEGDLVSYTPIYWSGVNIDLDQ